MLGSGSFRMEPSGCETLPIRQAPASKQQHGDTEDNGCLPVSKAASCQAPSIAQDKEAVNTYSADFGQWASEQDHNTTNAPPIQVCGSFHLCTPSGENGIQKPTGLLARQSCG
jgi:hypothetical protein